MSDPQSVIRRYSHSDLAKRDISDAIRVISSLKMSTENFTFNDGSSRLLVKLTGVLPVSYRGATYNFPIDVYFLENHPYTPPIFYVRPTSTMIIKSGKHVDSNGLVYHPYLSEWQHPRSDTKTLLRNLQTVFGDVPPLYSRAASSAQPPASTVQQPPTMTGAYPGMNAAQAQPVSQPMYSYVPGSGMPQPYGGHPPPGPPSSNYMPAGWGAVPNNANSTGAATGGGYQPPYPSPYIPPVGTAYPVASATQQNYNTGTVNESHFRLSILTAIEDKMRPVARDIESSHNAEMEIIKQNQSDISKNDVKIKEYLRKAENEKTEVAKAIEDLKRSNQELEKTLKELESQDSLDVDEAFDATTPLYKQMVAAFAEDQAISDAIYFLGEALGKNVIDVELFLKKVRFLSRKQFMLRATIQKCRITAGLPAV